MGTFIDKGFEKHNQTIVRGFTKLGHVTRDDSAIYVSAVTVKGELSPLPKTPK